MTFENKRKKDRLPVQMNAVMLHKDDEEFGSCSLMDISVEGIGILLNKKQAVTAGSNFKFIIDIPPRISEAVGTVIWTRDLKSSTGFSCAAGVKITDIENDHVRAMFDYARTQLYGCDKP